MEIKVLLAIVASLLVLILFVLIRIGNRLGSFDVNPSDDDLRIDAVELAIDAPRTVARTVPVNLVSRMSTKEASALFERRHMERMKEEQKNAS